MASKNPLLVAQKITIHGFINEFKRRHEQMEDRPFCWILGSGASIQSKIPTGEKLAMQWLKELHELEDFDQRPIEEWATAENLEIPDFSFARAADFYPWIYQRRFRDYKEQGYAFLEKAMDHTEPSLGYSVLAQIMAATHHKVAITTNFDNLIADALSFYARIFPLVCGHESVTGCIRANLRRPIIAKIHRDLLLNPWSNPEDIAKLSGQWATALTKIFERFTPIVIGCGGSDGSLMNFLKTLTPIEGGIFWCHHEINAIDPSVHEVVLHHRGRLVPITGFDEVMLQLQEKLQLPSLLPPSQKIDDTRATDHQEPFEALTEAPRQPSGNGAARSAAHELTDEQGHGPTREPALQPTPEPMLERAHEPTPAPAPEPTPVPTLGREHEPTREQPHVPTPEQVHQPTPAPAHEPPPAPVPQPTREQAPEPTRKAAETPVEGSPREKDWRAWQSKADAEPDAVKREAIFRAAIEDFPGSDELFGNFAAFMKNVRKDYDEAERLYRKALELNPNHANNTGNFAIFMKSVRKDYDQAERLYRKALELDPHSARNTGSFAVFMEDVRKNYDEAERLHRKALELDPNHANNTGNFAVFMKNVRKDYDQAERLYRKALELDPKHVLHTGNFAAFMEDVRKNYEEAGRLYKKALELNPKNEWLLKRYEAFRQAPAMVVANELAE